MKPLAIKGESNIHATLPQPVLPELPVKPLLSPLYHLIQFDDSEILIPIAVEIVKAAHVHLSSAYVALHDGGH